MKYIIERKMNDCVKEKCKLSVRFILTDKNNITVDSHTLLQHFIDEHAHEFDQTKTLESSQQTHLGLLNESLKIKKIQ
jgi:hypothetical protein